MLDATPPTPIAAAAIEEISEVLYDRLRSFAKSWGVLDIALAIDGWYVDAEVQFTTGPDMGLSLHTGVGECRYCVLEGSDGERWLDHLVADLRPLDESLFDATAKAVLDGLLDARRPLLPREG